MAYQVEKLLPDGNAIISGLVWKRIKMRKARTCAISGRRILPEEWAYRPLTDRDMRSHRVCSEIVDPLSTIREKSLLEMIEELAIPEPMSGCWIWTGYHQWSEYGLLHCHGKTYSTHRLSYELHKGPIPDGLVIDHLCRNPACVNPDHLEAVTQQENTLRGISPAARKAKDTHCVNGHEYSTENTEIVDGWRSCLTCRRERIARKRK